MLPRLILNANSSCLSLPRKEITCVNNNPELFFFFLVVLLIEGALLMLGKASSAELHPQPTDTLLNYTFLISLLRIMKWKRKDTRGLPREETPTYLGF